MMAQKLKINVNSRWWFVLLAIIITVVIIVFSFFYFRNQVNLIRERKNIELSTISKMKIDQFVNWYNERSSDALVISRSPLFASAVERLLVNKNNNGLKEEVSKRLSLPQKEYGYDNISLLTINGELLSSAGLNPECYNPIISEKIAEAIESRNITRTDLYSCDQNDKINYDVIAPIVNEKDMTIAVLVFHIEPEDYMYPLIQSYPTPSKTSETMLVRKDNDSVVFLNDLRHQKNTALRLKIPLTAKDYPSVKAVSGYTGLWNGKDYRGVDVVAYIQDVPNTEWFMVTKIDRSEMYTDLYREGINIIIGFCLIILLVVAGLAFLYNNRQRRIFKELWNASEEHTTTLQSIGDAVISTDNKGTVHFMNTVAEQLTGWGASEAKGKNLTEVFKIVNEETRMNVKNPVEKVILEGFVVGLANHTILISKDGKEIPIADSASPITNKEGEIIGIVLVFKDQTEEREAQMKILSSEERFKQISENSQEWIWEVDSNGLYTYSSKAAENLSGYHLEEIIGKKYFYDFFHPEEREKLTKVARIAIKQRRSFREFIYRFVNKDGETVIVSKNGIPVLDNHGNLLGYRGADVNITERKRAEKELLMAKDRAEESDRLKSAFLANMSHEIRTPMNGILGFAQLLRDPYLTGEEQQKFLGIMEKSGERMLNIINALVSISKIESGQMEISISDTNVNEQIDFVYSFFKPVVEENRMQLIAKKALPSKEAIIKSDLEKIYAILTNLVGNATKFTRAGSIEFGYEKKGKYLEFFVKDTGDGIADEKKEIIFERFRQGSESYDREFEGAGLGLSIAKSYVEILGGKIWVESELGKGSTFYFTIPYNAETEAKTVTKEPISTEDKDGVTKNLKILIVEDDEASEMFLSTALTKFDKELLIARNGIEAVEICRNNPDIDLILMDIRIPDMGGYEATRQIREFNKDVVIIAQTAYGLSGDRKKAIEAGCTDYISKPIDINLLKALIRKHFNK